MNEKRIVSIYETLNDTDKAVLNVISIICNTDKNLIAELLKKFGKTDDEKALNTPSKITPVISRLVKTGLFDHYHPISPEEADVIYKWYVDDKSGRSMASYVINQVENDRPGSVNIYFDYSYSLKKTWSLLRLSILGSSEKIYQKLRNNALASGILVEAIRSLCMNPVRTEWLETIPEGIREDILDIIMEITVCHDEKKIPESLGNLFCTTNLQKKTDANLLLSRRLYLMAIGQLHSKGETNLAALEKEGLTRQIDFYGLYGLDLLISGKPDEAAEYWRNNIAAAKKTTKKKHWIMPGYCGLIYIYMILAGIAEENEQTMKTFFSFMSKNPDLSPETVHSLEFLNRAWLFKNFELSSNEFECFVSRYTNENSSRISGITFIFMMLSCCLVENGYPSYMKNICAAIFEKIKQNGSVWLMAETAFFLEQFDVETEGTEKQGAFLAPSFKVLNRWESAIEALKNVFDKTDATSTGSDKRLAWVISLKENHIYPIEQKITAKGGVWSAGKKKSAAKLKSEKPDFLTDQDVRILGSMKMIYDYYNGYGMEFSFEDTLPLMVGHPVIFRKNKDSTLTHVDLISGKPQLSVKKGKKGLKLSINPFPNDKKVCVIEEPQDRIRVVQFSDEIIRVAKIIGKNGTYFPDEAEKMITEILAPASPFLDIQSDLAATSRNIETVESNSTPGVLLYPAGEAIKADIVIMPLGENGPLFKPGQGGEIIMTELEGKRIQAIRNLKAEKEGSGRLIATCPSLEQSAKSFLWYSEDLEEILELVSELKDAAAKGIAAVSWPEGKKFGIKTSIDTDKLNLRISSGTDWFDIEGTATAEDGEDIGLKAILKGLSRDSRFIKIGDNEFIALSKSLHKKLLALESASETIKTGARIGKGAAIMLREVLSGIKSTKTDRAWKNFQKRIEEAVELVPELPSTFQAELRPYQEEGFTWLCRLGALGVGACLADDMGLGKTIQALAFLLSTASKGPSLVVAPTSVCGNWMAETLRFAPTLNPVIFGGNEREQMLKNLAPMDLLIVSYGLMQQEEKLFEAVNWNVIVLDEAQAIKNETSKRTQTALKLKAGFRLITTGTPVENSLEELYTLFSFINPGLLGSKNSFNEKFAFPIEREQSRSARNSLRQLIKPFILRRLRTDVLDDLPEKTEIVINVEPGTAQKAVYETLRKDIVNDLENSDNQPPGQKYLKILAGITKLRLACCHPELAAPGCETEGAKTEIFMELVEELLENRHKALVFSQFTSFLSIVRKTLDEKGIKYLYLDGSTPAKERNENVARFQAGGADLFLISLKAGGTGLNLTAANYVIHLDPWWNPAVEDQASARAHRMGQKQPVTIYRLVMKESIEEKIMALHKHKKNLAESILEGAESAGKMSAEELMNLIKNG